VGGERGQTNWGKPKEHPNRKKKAGKEEILCSGVITQLRRKPNSEEGVSKAAREGRDRNKSTGKKIAADLS